MNITADTIGTRNYDKHKDGSPVIITPKGVMLHHGGGTIASDLKILRGLTSKPASSGWYAKRNGEIIQLGPENRRYWHAGAPDYDVTTWWGNEPATFGVIDGNLLFGMETEHREGQNWPTMQLQAIDDWGKHYTSKYNFALTKLGAHRWYAPSRKHDPSDISDKELERWFKTWVLRPGKWMKIKADRGAYIRQGPSVDFPIASALDKDARFWAAPEMVEGVAPEGTTNNLWVHYIGPKPEIVSELGFIWSGIVEDA